MTVADEICFESRLTPILFFLWRRHRAHQPACFRGAGFRLGGETQEKGRDVLLCAGKREAAAGDQIEDFRFTRNLDDDGAERGAGQSVGCRLDRIVGMGGADQQYLRWVDAEFEKAGGGQLTEFQRREILPDPENPFLARDARRKSRGKRSGGGFGIRGGIDFVQCTTLKPAFEGCVSRCEA